MTSTSLAAHRAAARLRIAAALLALAGLAGLAAPVAAAAALPIGADVPLPPPPAGTSLLPRGGPSPLARPGSTLALAIGPVAPFSGSNAVALSVDYGFPGQAPAGFPFALEWHVPVTVSLPGASAALTQTLPSAYGLPPTTTVTGSTDDHAVLVEVVATARLVHALGPGVTLHADGGAGLSEAVERIVKDELSVGHTRTTKLTTAGVVRLGAGLGYDLSEGLRLTFDPIVLSWQLGGDWSYFGALLGIAYRL